MSALFTAEQNVATGAKSLADLMGKRLDAFLPTLQSDKARRIFLTRHLEKFTEEARGVLYGEDSPPYVPGFGYPSAFDYHLTISEIRSRLSALKTAEVA